MTTSSGDTRDLVVAKVTRQYIDINKNPSFLYLTEFLQGYKGLYGRGTREDSGRWCVGEDARGCLLEDGGD